MKIAKLSRLLPITSAQRDFWDAAEYAGVPGTHVCLAEYIEIFGEIDPKRMEEALRELINEAQALHTVKFLREDAEVVRVIDSNVSEGWELPCFDLVERADGHEIACNLMLERMSRGYHPERGPFFDFALFRIGSDKFYWYQGYAHIVIDGYSCNLVARRVAELYSALEEGRDAKECGFSSLEELIEEDRTYRQSLEYQEDRLYWLSRFADNPHTRTLAGPEHRSERSTLLDLRETRVLTKHESHRFALLAQDLRSTFPRVLGALVATYVYSETKASDLILSVTAKARSSARELKTPCQNANMLPLRLSQMPMPLGELVERVSREMDDLRRHQRYRMGDIHREVASLRNSQGVFGTEFNVMSFDYDLRFGRHKATSHNISVGITDDFMVNLTDRRDGGPFRLDFDASPQYYTRADVKKHADGFCRLVRQALL